MNFPVFGLFYELGFQRRALFLKIARVVCPKSLKKCTMKTRQKRNAFSLLEVIAAVIILAVVAAATISTIAPMRAKSEQKLNDQTAASLNGMSQTYFLEYGQYPENGVSSLAGAGYLSTNDEAAKIQLEKMAKTFSYESKTGVFSN